MRLTSSRSAAVVAVILVFTVYMMYAYIYGRRRSIVNLSDEWQRQCFRINATSTFGSRPFKYQQRLPAPGSSAQLVSPGSSSSSSSSATQRPAIPKILHHVFSSIHVFEGYRPMIESCLRLNPDWKYYLWTEADANALIDRHYPQLKLAFGSMKMRLERSDATRYIVMHRFGGVYLDMDIECKQPLLPTIGSYPAAFTGQEAQLQSQIQWNRNFVAANAILGSVPGHPFFQRLIDKLASVSHDFGDVMTSTGPLMMTMELEAYWQQRTEVNSKHPVSLTPPDMFLPLMDESADWIDRCRKLTVDVDTIELERWYGCLRLKCNNWILPRDFSPSTIGVHHWIHLGHKPGFMQSRFNAAEAFKERIHFYSAES